MASKSADPHPLAWILKYHFQYPTKNVGDVGAPYVALTLPEVRYKSHESGACQPRLGRPKAVPFAPDMLDDIVTTMAEIIHDALEHLTLYRSFFVVEAKGIKLWTKTSSPLESLIK